MKTSIIICTRLNSNRLPSKAAIKINGKPVLQHLHDRLIGTGIEIIYAIPTARDRRLNKLLSGFSGEFKVFSGADDDPLLRMRMAAEAYGVDNCIRITHDKIFIRESDIYKGVDTFNRLNLDYLYSADFTPGTGFEIISMKALRAASDKFKNIEHISYSIKAITKNQHNMLLKNHSPDCRLLIDFPEDVELMTVLLANLGNDATLDAVLEFMRDNKWASTINSMPKVTVYTCAYNAEKYVMEAMKSVSMQTIFNKCEFLLIDDHSTDKTSYAMSRFSSLYPNVKYIRNQENIGLASSSNVALVKARGQYITRLDADDYFTSISSLDDIYKDITTRGLDVVYPNNYFGGANTQKGSESHHIGGAIFSTKAINHLKFSDGLRNYEGLDLWHRAKDQLNIGYLNKPIFYYRQHDTSMSKTNLSERQRVKENILNGQV